MSDDFGIALADEVAEDLNRNQGGWQVSFNATREYLPTIELKNTDVLSVQAGFTNHRKTRATRRTFFHDFDIEIGVLYRADPAANKQPKAKLDEIMRLRSQIGDHYDNVRPTIADATLMDVQYGVGGNGQPYIPEHIEKFNQITCVIKLTFRKEI